MDESTVTSKGQTTIPLSIRNALQAEAGTKLKWFVMPDNSIVVQAKNKSIFDLVGSVKPSNDQKVKIGDMSAWK